MQLDNKISPFIKFASECPIAKRVDPFIVRCTQPCTEVSCKLWLSFLRDFNIKEE